jgi:hypothetical protein
MLEQEMADRVVMQAQNPNGDFVPVTSSVGPVDTTYMQRVLVFGMDANGAQHPIQCDANGNIGGGGGGSGTPGGTSGSIQYNAAGAFGGSAAIIDAAGNFNNVGLSGNGFQLTTTAPGTPPSIIAAGSDANIAINLTPKGTGTLYVNTATCYVATNCVLGLSNSTSYLQFGVGALTCGGSVGVTFKANNITVGYAAATGLAVWLTPAGTSTVVPANGANFDVSSIRAATSGLNQNSGIQNFTSNFWNGAASANDYWSIQNVLGAGTNPTSVLTFTHAGSTGAASVSLPGGLTLGGTITTNAVGISSIYGLQLTRTAAASNSQLYSSTGTLNLGGNSAGTGMVGFNTNASITPYAMVVAAGGNVGIGINAPTAPLHVVGLAVYANNAAAITGGLTAGAFYRTGTDPDTVCVVH